MAGRMGLSALMLGKAWTGAVSGPCGYCHVTENSGAVVSVAYVLLLKVVTLTAALLAGYFLVELPSAFLATLHL